MSRLKSEHLFGNIVFSRGYKQNLGIVLLTEGIHEEGARVVESSKAFLDITTSPLQG
jgi:hypothetical protein